MVAPSQLLSADSDATPITDTTSIKAPSAAIDLLSGDSAGLISRQVGSELATLADNLSIAPPSAPEERPATPAKDPAFTAVMSPPPPSPPPKDVPPKDVPPKDLPPKDAHLLAPELYLDLPPSRPASPMPSIPTKSQASSDDENDGTSSVIHDLFQKSHRAFVAEEQHSVSSPSSSLPSLTSVHPPRSSSLEATPEPLPPAPPPRPQATSTAKSQNTPHRPPPPDEDLPFDFHRFLSQLRHRSADPVAKFLRSFLSEFAKKQWMVHEQVKIVRDFLTFIYAKMDLCEVWREVGDGEMDNAMEGMEKLVMNRLYTQTFSPAIQPHDGVSRVDERFPGRRGQHQEDVERDEILTQKVRIYSWVREEHLDIGNTVSGDGGRKFLDLAVKEMRKIGTYRAPRDKVICVLNCCKVIFGLLRHSGSDESADKFVPILIYVVLQANPENLVSNVQYILRFRNPDKLSGEAGYYLSSLMGAIQFIESLDRSSLTISPEEFESNVEAAIAKFAERPTPQSPPPSLPPKPRRPSTTAIREKGGADFPESGDEKLAVAGLLRSLQEPLSTIGRIFTGEGSSSSTGPPVTPRPGSSPNFGDGMADDAVLAAFGGRRHQPVKRRTVSAQESATRQAAAEAEEAARIGMMEYEHVVETLQRMFPGLDRDVICDVVNIKEGQVGAAVDACLALCTS